MARALTWCLAGLAATWSAGARADPCGDSASSCRDDCSVEFGGSIRDEMRAKLARCVGACDEAAARCSERSHETRVQQLDDEGPPRRAQPPDDAPRPAPVAPKERPRTETPVAPPTPVKATPAPEKEPTPVRAAPAPSEVTPAREPAARDTSARMTPAAKAVERAWDAPAAPGAAPAPVAPDAPAPRTKLLEALRDEAPRAPVVTKPAPTKPAVIQFELHPETDAAPAPAKSTPSEPANPPPAKSEDHDDLRNY